MHDPFEKFILWLEERLKGPLPGYEAQMLMMPKATKQDRFSFNQKKTAKLGSVLLLLYPHKGKVYLPLMKRPEYDGVHSGQISFPGGKMEEGDPDLIFTALREGQEEIGIRPEDVKVLGNLTEHMVVASNFNVLPVIGYLGYRPRFIADLHEVAEVLEVSIDHLQDDRNRREKELLVRGRYWLKAPYYDVGGHVVWGATAMMLSEFLMMVKGFDDGTGPEPWL